MEKILTLNAGSSSIKFAVFDADKDRVQKEPVIRGQIAGLGARPFLSAVENLDGRIKKTNRAEDVQEYQEAWSRVLDWLDQALNGAPLVGIGHRVVHGGLEFSNPIQIDERVLSELQRLVPLAPGHQPFNLEGVAAASKNWPQATQVACFDTAFHRTLPAVEQTFALPRRFTDDGIIRYGFHGLSYEHIAQAAPEILGDHPHERLIVAHLGAGASMCAIKDGASVATTMGFTALDGLPMATRCGALDPGIVLHLIKDKGMSADEVATCLHKKSGLFGVSGISGDMRELEQSEDARAAEAIDLFVYRIAREIGSLTAALGGVDALIFTAGIGENSPDIRARILHASQWLKFEIDQRSNNAGGLKISLGRDTPSAWVIPTNEELMIAQQVHKLTVKT